MTTDLNTLLTALYVKIDDRPRGQAPPRQAAQARTPDGSYVCTWSAPGRTADRLGVGRPKIGERQVLMALCDHEHHLLADAPDS